MTHPIFFTPPQVAAREHIAWCVSQGMTANDVCESVDAYLTDPTWADAQAVVEKRWRQLQRHQTPFTIISERKAG